MSKSLSKEIRKHYEAHWHHHGQSRKWPIGPLDELPSEFSILEFAPTAVRKMWTYATCGMSMSSEYPRLELHLFSPHNSELHVELLTVIAHYHLTGKTLDLGHTINFGRPWLPNSQCSRGLISRPYLDGPALEWLEFADVKIRFLWLIPITEVEWEFAKRQGLSRLEEKFEQTGLDYVNPYRPSLV